MSKLIRKFAIKHKNENVFSNSFVQICYVSLVSLSVLISTRILAQNDDQNYNNQQRLISNNNNDNKPLSFTQANEQQQRQQISKNDATSQPVNEICCPCDEAKYELIFEGLWSKYTHPDEFPESDLLAYFGDIIGASHSNEFRMWESGSLASEGVKELAESGSTKRLESELKLASSRTRTIIKARELRYPTLNSKTSAVFRTDKRHHLVSILSKLGSTSDLMVGVSALNLCQADCTWSTQKIVNLFPFDSGIDSSENFTKQSKTNPTNPQEPIKPYQRQTLAANYLLGSSKLQGIRAPNNNNFAPDTVDSSFSLDQSKPFARLTITRQRIYEKFCNHSEQLSAWPTTPGYYATQSNELNSMQKIQANQQEQLDSDNNNQWPTSAGRIVTSPAPPNMLDCRYTSWSDWTSCSSSCGKGTRTRTRSFKNDRYAQTGCSLGGLVEKEFCLSECRGNNGTCVTRDWSLWSRCSVDCGQGRRKRTRSIIGPRASACEQIDLVEEEPCIGMGDCSAVGNLNGGPNQHGRKQKQQQHQAATFMENDENVNCQVSSWSAWTECSRQPCGGTRIRTRKLVHPENMAQCKMQFIQKRQCPVNAELCRQTFADVATTCNLAPDKGPCFGDFTRWYYDNSTQSCYSFTFKGCAGNQNNFDTFQDCDQTCAKPMRKLQSNNNSHSSNNNNNRSNGTYDN